MKNNRFIQILYICVVAFLLYFILTPVISVFIYGFSGDASIFFSLKDMHKSILYLKNSLIIAVPVTILSTIMGIVMAFTLGRISFKGRRALKVLALLPFVNPPFVGSISYIMLFGRRGLITHKLLGLDISPYGPYGIVIIKVLTLSSVAYILISSSLKKFDTTLEEAARNLGASERTIFKTITLPLMIPEISNTALLVFLASMADFSTPIFIGGSFQTLASHLYLQIIGTYDMRAATLSGVILLIPCLIVFFFQKYYLKNKNRQFFSDDNLSLDIEYKNIGKITRVVLITITTIFISVVLLKYVFIIIGAFTKHWGYDYTFTLENFKVLFSSQYKPFVNSVKLAVITAVLSSFIGILIAYMIQFRRAYKANIIDFLATLPAAVPGILFGIGYLVAFRYPILGIGRWILKEQKPLLLLGTGIIVYINLIARYVNTGLRFGYAVLEHINPDLENASYNLGGGEIRTFSSIMVPLLKDAFFASFIRSFTSGMTSLGSIIFLLLPSNRVAVQEIFTIMASRTIGEGATMALSLSLLTLLLLGIFYSIFYMNRNIMSYKMKGFNLKWK